MLPWDFTSLVDVFDTSGAATIEFLRHTGPGPVVGGVVLDAGFAPLVLSPQWVFVPQVPKDEIQRLPEGDRHKSGCLVWSVGRDFLGTVYPTLRTIDQAGHTRADRIVDVDRGLTYVVRAAWVYERQSLIAGAIGILLDSDNSQD